MLPLDHKQQAMAQNRFLTLISQSINQSALVVYTVVRKSTLGVLPFVIKALLIINLIFIKQQVMKQELRENSF